jgi:hypothetical protein
MGCYTHVIVPLDKGNIMADEVREVFPMTFLHGQGPVILAGSNVQPQVEIADNPEPLSADNPVSLEEGSTVPQTTVKKVEKPKAAAPD